jgi:CRISPR-associated endonuclease/helicase Cas3
MSIADFSRTPKQFYAHSDSCQDRSDWQFLDDHLACVARLAADSAENFNTSDLAYVAGLLHDLSKYTKDVQRRIAGENIRAEHAIQGAQQAITQYGKQIGTLLTYIIAGHHAGLANGRDDGDRTSLQGRLTRSDAPKLLPEWQEEVTLPPQCSLPQNLKPHPDRSQVNFQWAFLIRMLYSCVVDTDFLDTEAHYDKAESRPSLRDGGPLLSALRDQLNKKLAGFKADSEMNRLRADILHYVRGQAVLSPGLFSLSVPTGGGKTLVSLAFALDHALAHKLKRVIYVIPFTFIVEQNAAVFRDAFGELGEAATP